MKVKKATYSRTTWKKKFESRQFSIIKQTLTCKRASRKTRDSAKSQLEPTNLARTPGG